MSGDEISIVYNFAKYVSQGILESPKLIRDTIKYQQAGRYEVDGDITRYFYPISEAGKHHAAAAESGQSALPEDNS